MSKPTPVFDKSIDVHKYFMENPIHINGSIICARITKDIAKEYLFLNKGMIKNGDIYYYAIKHIGLDVYEIKPRPLGKYNTYIVDSWEPHTISSSPGAVGTQCY